MSWTHTLDLRQSGAKAGFLATDIPLEDQDLALGGPLVDDTETASTAWSKGQLVDEAQRLGLDVPGGATKADIVALIRGE